MPSLPDMTTPDVAELARDAAAHSHATEIPTPDAGQDAFFETLLRIGDSTLILGHRVSEWCGHAPALEEDIALANVALDLIGQTQMWLGLAGRGRGQGPHRRRPRLPARRLGLPQPPPRRAPERRLRPHADAPVPLRRLPPRAPERRSPPRRTPAWPRSRAKAAKEVAYHLERSSDLVIRLGDGTAESHRRMQDALDALWPYTGEMFLADDEGRPGRRRRPRPRPGQPQRPPGSATVRDVLTAGDARDPRERASPTRAASAASTPSISASSSPTCSSCSAPTPAPPGRTER